MGTEKKGVTKICKKRKLENKIIHNIKGDRQKTHMQKKIKK